MVGKVGEDAGRLMLINVKAELKHVNGDTGCMGSDGIPAKVPDVGGEHIGIRC